MREPTAFIVFGDCELALGRSDIRQREQLGIAPIRDTPRFRALLDRMGLLPHHAKSGAFERARQRVANAARERGGSP